MEYNDGFHYAINLSRKGFKNIELMPDASFASLLSCLEYNIDLSKRSCVLLGANGVDKNTKDCGHTSGHLMMAIVAKEYHVPVYIIADSFKIGDIKWNPNLVRDEASWLVGQKSYLDELKNNKITVKNYREDRILREYITGYISNVDIDINSDEPLDIEYSTTLQSHSQMTNNQ
jgi:translation initiation factor 2B subunit (eIF-2B alpha/beta/delta family)